MQLIRNMRLKSSFFYRSEGVLKFILKPLEQVA